MTHLEIAQKIADKIDAHTQEEVEAMITIVCDIHGIDDGWMYRVVGNLYMKSGGYQRAANDNSATRCYSEREAR
jgi:hypothetical protein